MKVSVIDIGSNTVKATVFSLLSARKRTVVDYKGYKCKLIACVEEKNGIRILSEEGLSRLTDALSGLVEFSASYSCEKIFTFATASLRGIENSADVLTTVKETLGLDIEILTGEEEALCSLRGLLSDEITEDVDSGIMVDMGGGSTEVVYFSNGSLPKLKSLSFGCVSLYERFVKNDFPTDEEISAIEKYVAGELLNCDYAKGVGCPMFLIGGSARAVGKISYGKDSKNILRADGSDFSAVLKKFRDPEFAQKAESIVPGRSLTVSPAAVAYRKIASFVAPSAIFISESGVREGYLEKILP